MGRKKQEGFFELVVGIAALLPWWAGVAGAAMSYFALHLLAAQPVVTNSSLSDSLTHSLLHAAGAVGQYLVPCALLLGSLMSAFGRRKRSGLLTSVGKHPPHEAVAGMSWRDFELLVGESFRLQGFKVTEGQGRGPDGGVDLVLRKDGKTHLVQCKHWKKLKVSVSVVREMYGLMAARGASGAFVVTSGKFTSEAETFASENGVTLIDGKLLQQMITAAAASLDSPLSAKPNHATARPAVQRESGISAKLSSSKLASARGISTAELFRKLVERGLVIEEGGRHHLTDAGRQAGGEWRSGYGGYILWPTDLALD